MVPAQVWISFTAQTGIDTIIERAKAVYGARTQSLLSLILAKSLQPAVAGTISHYTCD
jgi:hypothetical protein